MRRYHSSHKAAHHNTWLTVCLSVSLSAGSVLRSETRDLRLVLQSSDKELAAVKAELMLGQGEQQKELGQLSSTLITTQLQLDTVQ